MDFNTVGIITKFYGHIKISVTLVNAILLKILLFIAVFQSQFAQIKVYI